MKLASACATALLLVVAAPAFAAWPKLPTDNLPLRSSPNADLGPAIVEDGAGGMIVITSPDGLVAVHVIAAGVLDLTWPADGTSLGTFDGRKPALASDGAGGAIVTWEDYRVAGGPHIYAAHVLASGALDPAWPVNGLAVCTASKDQLVPTIVSDGAGGAVIAWQDDRVFYDVYAQHVLASGVVDPAWPVNGRALCTATDGQGSQAMVSDGAGGAIVTWHDFRTHTNWDIYAQHVFANGVVDPAWPVDGRAICTAASHQDFPMPVSDGAGGAIITWQDRRSGPYWVYAQHVSAAGVIDPTWPVNGAAVSTATSALLATPQPRVVSDGAGGALVTWQDDRAGTFTVVYAQHLKSTGGVDPLWPSNGVRVCPFGWKQVSPVLTSDAMGGAIIAWRDYRTNLSHVYAQRLLANSILDSNWPADGTPVCTASGTPFGYEDSLTIASDGQHGALLAWRDYRGAWTRGMAYAQRVWSGGLLGSRAPEITGVLDVAADQGGLVSLNWNGSYNDADPQLANSVTQYTIYRQLPASPQAAALPASSGRLALRTGATTTYWQAIGVIAASGASTYRLAVPTLADSTASAPVRATYMIDAQAPLSSWFSVPDTGASVDNLAPIAPAALPSWFTGSTVQLNWQPVTAPDLAGYRIYSGVAPSFVPSPGNFAGQTSSTTLGIATGAPLYYRVTAVDVHGNPSGSTLLTLSVLGVGDGAPPAAEGLAAARPNPASRATTMHFTLPRAGNVRLAVYDAAGREVRTLADGAQPAGQQDRIWDLNDARGRGAGAGLYFARLVVDGREHVQRVVVTR